ncbi:hypothetical protein ACFODT_06500 [Vibrio zhugei]|uniref:Transposase n=1 Tax=Vibrio zhugei TaxID=2479546 RepID=A0ABV7C9Q1_9VIBR|nr:hypothetical protein [Vibrio zhugei]
MDNSPWKGLDLSNARRVNHNGQYDFFWVVVEDKQPALMLRLPIEPTSKPKLPELKNLIANFRIISGRWAFVLALKENSQAELLKLSAEMSLSQVRRLTIWMKHSLGRYNGLKGGIIFCVQDAQKV